MLRDNNIPCVVWACLEGVLLVTFSARKPRSNNVYGIDMIMIVILLTRLGFESGTLHIFVAKPRTSELTIGHDEEIVSMALRELGQRCLYY